MNSKMNFFLMVLFVVCLSPKAWSQNQDSNINLAPKSIESKPEVTNSISQNYLNTTKAIESRSTTDIANGYVTLADQFISNGDNTNAEKYLNLARNLLESDDKKNRKSKELLSRVYGKIAQIQSLENRSKESRLNYDKTNYHDQDRSETVDGKKDNSASGLVISSYSHLDSTSVSILKKNIASPNSKLKVEDKVVAYSNLVNARLEENKTEEAVEDFKQVIADKTLTPQVIQLSQMNKSISEKLVEQGNYQDAIQLNKDFINSPSVASNSKMKAQEKQKLASLMIEGHMNMEAEKEIKESFQLSIKNGHTMEAILALKQLQQLYTEQGKSKQLLPEYQELINLLPDMIDHDSSLLENRVLEVTGDRILQLQNETQLKDELIAKQKMFGIFLIGGLLLAALLIFFILRSLKTIKRSNKQIHLQSLRREMNPHFIFNSLNSVNQYISNRNELEANKYLTNFSKLMRDFMENSTSDFIKIDKEIAQLELYVKLEHQRFSDVFDYKFTVDDSLRDETLWIPNMLIQPFVENAVWHGLRYRDDIGLLIIDVKKSTDNIVVIIEDDGIGYEESKKVKTKFQKQSKGRGVSNIKERINLLNSLYNMNIQLQQTARDTGGVKITLYLPFKTKI